MPKATTYLIGEESSSSIGGEEDTTTKYGEESFATTNSLGEEGGPSLPDEPGTDPFGGF